MTFSVLSCAWPALVAAPPAVISTSIGFLSGAAGAFAVYPFDYVKTQLQTAEGRRKYGNIFAAFPLVLSDGGLCAFYQGCGVQIAGVAPEKALKLSVNDAARSLLTRSFGPLSIAGEIAAGVCAGGCQVLITNPLEVLKVRLQTDPRRRGVLAHLREVGLIGLYQGATTCALRDASFSAVLFPCYHHAKLALPESLGPLFPHYGILFLAGVVSAAPAALVTTPGELWARASCVLHVLHCWSR